MRIKTPPLLPGPRAALLLRLAVTTVFASLTAPGQAQTSFGNTGAIMVNDAAPATPYPSIVSVSGISGLIGKLTVVLSDVTHANPEDLEVLLVGPAGQKVVLMGQAGGINAISHVSITFDDAAASVIPDSSQILSSTYRPANYGTDNLPAPAPPVPYGTSLSQFNGANPNVNLSL